MGWLGSVFGQKEYKGQDGASIDQINATYAAGQGIQGQQQDLAAYLAQRAHAGQPLDFTAANRTLGVGDQLLGQTMDAANGVGPNPALEQLKQTTGANIQQAAGMVASARGVNPAMAARVAATTGANVNQQAAGQAATLAAQQQLAARAQAAGLVGQQAQQQAGLVTANEQAGAQRIGQQAEQLYGMGAQNLQGQQILQTAHANYQSARMGQRAQQNAAELKLGGDLVGAIAKGASAAAGGAAMAHGGEVEAPGPASGLGRLMLAGPQRYAGGGEVAGVVPGRAAIPFGTDSEAGDKVHTLLTPGEIVLPRSVTQSDDAPARAAEFVAHLIAARGDGFSRVLAARGPQKMSEGGEVSPSVVQAIRAWWNAKPGDEEKSKAVAEEAHKSLPEALSARKAIEKKRAQLQALDAQTSER